MTSFYGALLLRKQEKNYHVKLPTIYKIFNTMIYYITSMIYYNHWSRSLCNTHDPPHPVPWVERTKNNVSSFKQSVSVGKEVVVLHYQHHVLWVGGCWGNIPRTGRDGKMKGHSVECWNQEKMNEWMDPHFSSAQCSPQRGGPGCYPLMWSLDCIKGASTVLCMHGQNQHSPKGWQEAGGGIQKYAVKIQQ